MAQIDLKNLQIKEVSNNILLVKQINPPFYFSCSDGLILLPEKERNQNLIVLDLNIEPKYVDLIIEKYGKPSYYINTHGHMDHIAHVHEWEKYGAQILGPKGEIENLLNLNYFYRCYEFSEGVSFSSIEKFAKVNGYNHCQNISSFQPGEVLELEDLELQTIPLTGHSKSQVGFLLKEDKIFHISCMGFDISKPDDNGFGPWYGFKQCSIEQYIKDIDLAEKLYKEKADCLTSSHSYIVKKPDLLPFIYMRDKIKQNQLIVENALKQIDTNLCLEDKVQELLKMDLFFPKMKMNGFLKEIYTFWEYWIIKNSLIFQKKDFNSGKK